MTLVRATFSPPADRRSALDRAHVGDIEGALGSIPASDTAPRRTGRARLSALLAVAGPGMIVMAADNDAGGLAVYSQAGQDHGVGLLWVLVLLAPVLFINQEMVARLGAVTGAGHARLIVERFGRRWGAFAIGDLLALNGLTLVTDFIGVALALGALGVPRGVSVPTAALLLIAIVVGGGFRRWERAMLMLVAFNLLAVALAVLCWSDRDMGSGALLARSGDGGDGAALLLVIAMIGTTVAPWQLFLQQSNVVDKRLTPRWLSYARVDTLIGTALMLVVAAAVMLASAWAFSGGAHHGHFVDAGAVAHDMSTAVSPAAGTLFALALLNASLLGASAVTLSSSYAVGDYFGYRHSLHRGWRDARIFHRVYAGLIVSAAGVVLIPGVPLGALVTGVQALAGVLLPSASVFLLLLCNDEAVLGPWVNSRLVNVLGALVVGVLVLLSAMLIVTTAYPGVDMATLELVGLGLLGGGMGIVGLAARYVPRPPRRPSASPWDRATWTMPSIELLEPPVASTPRKVALVTMRAYLVLASIVLVVKVFEVAT